MSQAIKSSKYRIAIFVSGAGSNAKKIIEYFSQSPFVSVDLIVCNNPDAGVLKIAEGNHIKIIVLEKEKFFRGNCYVDELTEARIDLIVLAGFLWKIPALLVKAFSGKIINIHPALLPKYGGKGMYGSHVH
ncbi:MAG: formyltransferase family protein, partial [Panacibacter sp.]